MGIPFYKRKLRVTFLFFKKQAERKKYQACVSPFFFFLFLSLSCSKDGGKGNDDSRSTRPVRRTTARYKKNFVDGVFFFFFRCRGAATGVAGAVKVAPRGHAEGTSRPPFPKLPPKKNFFFHHSSRVHRYSFPNSVPNNVPFKKKKKKNFCFLHTFHCPRVASEVQFFSPFFISLSSNCSLTFAADIS